MTNNSAPSYIRTGLSTATELLVGGCSAGGLATYLQCDSWAERAKAAAASGVVDEGLKVRCMPDSGMFFDVNFEGAFGNGGNFEGDEGISQG